IVEWQKFFATEVGRNSINECSELRKLEELMNNTMQEYHAQGLQYSTAILIIPKIHGFLSNLETAVFKVLKLKCNVYPVFPLVFWLIERIRWTLDREKPYHLLGNKNNKGRAVDVSLMNIEAARVLSFYKWPHMGYKYALPYRMAETGFFFQPNINGDDRVVCFSCLISLVLWEPNDEPLQEHERHHTSRCAFNEDSCNDNVPLDVTTACQPFALIPFDNESIIIASTMNASAEFCLISLVLWEPNDEPLQEHERHHTSRCAFNEDSCNDNVPLDVTTACQPFALIPFDNESIIIASTMNASAELFAVADASNNSIVRMFHLDSCPLQPFILQFNFLRDLRFIDSEKMTGEYNNENSNQMSKITALSVAGRERFVTLDGDTDAVAQLYIGAT
uniref:Baculoviral IAP repeat-containing protein 6 n=1 Tax=Panagrolaimus sp. ES5 TaxID=591445 RepID=A0AC34GBJ8_9BILA